MKHLVFIITFLLFVAMSVQAQEGKEQKPKKKVKTELSDAEITDTLRTHISSLEQRHKKELKAKDAIIASLNKELQHTVTPKKIMQENTNLAAQNEVIKKQKDSLQNIVDSLNDNVIKDWESKYNAEAERGKQIPILQQQNRDLQAFKNKFLTQMAKSAEKRWLTLPFSQIKVADLESDWQLCSKYINDNEDAKKAADKLNSLLQQCYTYNKGIELIKKPYDAAAVNECQKKTERLLIETTGAKKQDAEYLVNQLKDYADRVWAFQTVIEAVDKRIKTGKDNGSSHSGTLRFIEIELKTQVAFIASIKSNPWLKAKFEEYERLLRKDCLAPNPVRDEIMKLKTE